MSDSKKHFHLLGIAGTGMGAFAGLLKQAGHHVTGSDQNVYPPMSHKLEEWGIEVSTPYAAENLPQCDLVVVGNVIRKTNIEATAMREKEMNNASFPETLSTLFLDHRHSIVVAGTHGKTTTSSLLAHALDAMGRDPGFLIGGILQNFGESFRTGVQDGPFVVEGDEYDTAYFDKGPKFLHYRAKSLLATSLEFDHADIYKDVDEIRERFRQLFSQMSEEGHAVYHAEAQHLSRALEDSKCKARVESYGTGGTYQRVGLREDESGVHFDVSREGEAQGALSIPLSGDHNADNALGAYAILRGIGCSHEEIALAFKSFDGVKRRMEVRGKVEDVTIVDDFAHHPTAVHTTLLGAKRKYAEQKIWALFEPRSATSCRNVFQEDYARAFEHADRVFIAPKGRDLDESIALDTELLAKDIRGQGKNAQCLSVDEIIEECAKAPAHTVLLCMSNGAFDNIHQRLLNALKERS